MIEEAKGKIPAEWTDVATQWEEAYNRGDAAGVAALYTEQASWCGSASGLLRGRAAIQAAMQKFMDMGMKTVKVEPIEVKAGADQGSGVTRFQFFGPNGQVIYSGHGLSVAEQQGGKLLIHHHWAVGDSQPK